MKARYPWVAVRFDPAKVGAVASETYEQVTQGIVRRNPQCFARRIRDEMRRAAGWQPEATAPRRAWSTAVCSSRDALNPIADL